MIAAQTFLADIARNVAGDRAEVASLIPLGIDPHAFQPTPQDIARIADSQVLIVNGAGFEEWLDTMLQNVGGEHILIVASAGLTSRETHAEETGETGETDHEDGHAHDEGDPHFWLDPNNVITYVENIRDGLTRADPGGRDVYAGNAEAYIAQLKDLDAWIRQQVETIPAERRLLVTNHESFGYFADRYGFKVIGTLIPSVSTGASPSAQQLARLIDRIRETETKAIFLEGGANPKLAEQIANETGVRVVTGLYTHSVTEAGGPAPTYIDMMKANVEAIVQALQ